MVIFETRLLIDIHLGWYCIFFSFIVLCAFPPVKDCLRMDGIGLSCQMNLHLDADVPDRIGWDWISCSLVTRLFI